MKQIFKIYWFPGLIVLSSAMVFYLYKASGLTDIILFLTYSVIIWYSWETRLLRQETRKAYELDNAPFLLVINLVQNNVALGQPDAPVNFKLLNVGKGVALKIVVEFRNTLGTIEFSKETPALPPGKPFEWAISGKQLCDVSGVLQVSFLNILGQPFRYDWEINCGKVENIELIKIFSHAEISRRKNQESAGPG
ncbi:MAG: hypothetical protein A2X34_09350 [Elusimicrobia bacterium GWC2_51_8]|nr:MAG: hypothetical protein A2X33_01090 [Elusimicrobia bacterium GWA2_51_34]OGR60306.1 MAG: hypothetical protein A2X34_09350 [Elusimicrobia bacterium GWC2_51_8]OGR85869.1 MAG: hypothetical protein A2021_03255 [Elusimicrobia bacterium GWF2_52_66]HAF96121.1 hypothetical protein [Elusimicrobiota bacterium]HCE97246.1 hypothetical protein [Elusimicrobiota bacterium]